MSNRVSESVDLVDLGSSQDRFFHAHCGSTPAAHQNFLQ
jgi:hypothetical protein